jgi:hypothetical protein
MEFVLGDPDRHGHAVERPDAQRLEFQQDALEGLHRLIAAGLGQHHHELVGAGAGHDVGGARQLREDQAHRLQHVVAHVAPVRSVDAPEAVDVDDRNGQRTPVAPATIHLAVEMAAERAQREKPREGVPDLPGLELQLERRYPPLRVGELLLQVRSMLLARAHDVNGRGRGAST